MQYIVARIKPVGCIMGACDTLGFIGIYCLLLKCSINLLSILYNLFLKINRFLLPPPPRVKTPCSPFS